MGKYRVRAIIIDQGRILFMKLAKKDSTRWFLPGGGVEEGETHELALVRECKEEIGVDVLVEKYFDVVKSNYLGQDHEHSLYFCKIMSGEVGTGEGPEFQGGDYYEGEHTLEWLSEEEFKDKDIKPDGTKERILKIFEN